MGKKCVIIGAGDFSAKDLPEKHTGELWIAADGGYAYCVACGFLPDFFIGDADSVEDVPREVPMRLLPRRKDDTDMIAAARYALKLGYDQFVLLGGLGGERLSHTIANLQTLSFLKENGADGVLKHRNIEVYAMVRGENRIFREEAGYFSLFAATERATVTVRGAKFNGERIPLTRRFPMGVSNEFSGKCLISVKAGEVYLIIEKR